MEKFLEYGLVAIALIVIAVFLGSRAHYAEKRRHFKQMLGGAPKENESEGKPR